MSDDGTETRLSRRAWLASLIPKAGEAVASVVEHEVTRRLPPERRPPGAVFEPLFLSLCERCGDCVTACPHAAVLTYTRQAGVKAGTPVMRPDLRACHLCEGYPCATACTTGALENPGEAVWSLGTAWISTERCITYQGPECGACEGLCPRGVEAIRWVGYRPEIDPGQCVGCGLCIEACPTTPASIELEPLVVSQNYSKKLLRISELKGGKGD